MATRTTAQIVAEIREHPELHRHDFTSLQQCCIIDGVFDCAVMEAHAGLFGENGGVRCDVFEGPCACGAWH